MYRILITTNDSKLGEEYSRWFVSAGHQASVVSFSGDAWLTAIAEQPSMGLLLDLRSSQKQPATIVAEVRTELRRLSLKDVPVMVLLEAGDLQRSRVIPGASDIFVHPAGQHELLLRVAQVFYRSKRDGSGKLIQIGGMVIDQVAFRATIDGAPVEMTFKEFELLRYLASRRGRVFTREALLAQVWGHGYYGGTRTVDVHIRRIRRKIGPRYEHLIFTVRNVGYRFEESEELVANDRPDVFLAGVMQGSNHGRGIHSQDYRQEIRALFEKYAPDANVYDPWENHSNSIDYDDNDGKSVFLHHLELAKNSKLVLSFLPTASLGTAVEIWEAFNAGSTVWTVSPMSENWVIRFFSHKVLADLDELEKAMESGELKKLGVG